MDGYGEGEGEQTEQATPSPPGVAFPCEAGLEAVQPHLGSVPFIPRRGLRVLDARLSTERHDEEVARRIRNLGKRFAEPIEVRRDVLYHGADLSVFRNSIWQGNTVFDGINNLKPNTDNYDMMKRLKNIGKYEKFNGKYAYIQKTAPYNYFHWTLECLPRLWILAPLIKGGQLDGVILVYGKEPPSFVAESIRFNFPEFSDRIIVTKSPLIVVDDLHFFVSGGPAVGQNSLTRVSTATKEMIDATSRRDEPEDHIAFVPRGSLGNRKLVNEDALIEYLQRYYKVDVIVGHALSVAEQRKRFSSPKAIVGVHGAGLSNVIYGPRGCMLIEISTTQYLARTASFHDPSLLSGGAPYVVLGDQVGDRSAIENNIGNDIFISPEKFSMIRELIG